jgi:hypothetical protein
MSRVRFEMNSKLGSKKVANVSLIYFLIFDAICLSDQITTN